MKFSSFHVSFLFILLLSSQCLQTFSNTIVDIDEISSNQAATREDLEDWMIPPTTYNPSIQNVLCEYIYPNDTQRYFALNPQYTCDYCYQRSDTGDCDNSELLCNFLSAPDVVTLVAINGSCGVLCYPDATTGNYCNVVYQSFRRLQKQPIAVTTPTAPSTTTSTNSAVQSFSSPKKLFSFAGINFHGHTMAMALVVIAVIVG